MQQPKVVEKVLKESAARNASQGKLRYTVFDFETNGKTTDSDVLTYAAKKFEFDPATNEHTFLKSMDGAYQPTGEFNEGATKVNGLNKAKIEGLRKDKKYGVTFEEDRAKLMSFLNDGDAVVAHNGNGFDYQFVAGLDQEKVKLIDTYTIAREKNLATNFFEEKPDGTKMQRKNNEALAYRYGETLDPSKAHEASFDVDVLQKSFKGMLNDSATGVAEQLFDPATAAKIAKEHKLSGKKMIATPTGERVEYTATGERIANTEKVVKKLEASVKQEAATFKKTLTDFKAVASKVSNGFEKLGTAQKAGVIAGVTGAILATGAVFNSVEKHRRDREQEKMKQITQNIDETRRGGW